MSKLEGFLAPVGDLNQIRRRVNIAHTVTKALANLSWSGLIRGVCTPSLPLPHRGHHHLVDLV